jgi:hypothetical protein
VNEVCSESLRTNGNKLRGPLTKATRNVGLVNATKVEVMGCSELLNIPDAVEYTLL